VDQVVDLGDGVVLGRIRYTGRASGIELDAVAAQCLECKAPPSDTDWAMSEANLTRFRQATAAFNRGDTQAWLEFFDPDCVFEPQVAVMEGAFTGHDGVRAFGQTIHEIFDTFLVDFDEVRDLGDDRLLALGSATSVGKGSGIEQRAALAILVQFRSGQVVRFTDFGDEEQALEAAGLSN